MLKIASDMAALTPGSTVEDAMNALSSASMGNSDYYKVLEIKSYKMTLRRNLAVTWKKYLIILKKI